MGLSKIFVKNKKNNLQSIAENKKKCNLAHYKSNYHYP